MKRNRFTNIFVQFSNLQKKEIQLAEIVRQQVNGKNKFIQERQYTINIK
jgi:hypothetical protein